MVIMSTNKDNLPLSFQSEFLSLFFLLVALLVRRHIPVLSLILGQKHSVCRHTVDPAVAHRDAILLEITEVLLKTVYFFTPKYASITFGSLRTFSGVPHAMTLPTAARKSTWLLNQA